MKQNHCFLSLSSFPSGLDDVVAESKAFKPFPDGGVVYLLSDGKLLLDGELSKDFKSLTALGGSGLTGLESELSKLIIDERGNCE